MSSVAGAPVLLVDDRQENLVALEAVLAPLGCRLVRAHTGLEALREVLRQDFAVILLDAQMPEMDGFEAADLIKQRQRSRLVPIIFLTAISVERHHVVRGYSAGAVDYVLKPFDPVVLRSKVEVFAELYTRGRALEASEALLRATFEDAPIGMARADADGRLLQVNAALCEALGRPEDDLLGRTLEEIGHPRDAGIDAELRAELLAGRIPRYEVERRLSGPGRASIPVQLSVSLARGEDGARPDLLLQVQDIRDRKRAQRDREQLVREQSARAQAEIATERLRLTQSLADAALSADDLDGLLRELLELIAGALEVDSAAVVLADEHDRLVARLQTGGEVEVDRKAAGDAVAAQVMQTRAPVAIRDVARAGVDVSALGAGVASALAVPLSAGGQVIGSLHVGMRTTRNFDADAIDLMRTGAVRTGLAIARTRLYERQRHIAQELQRSLLPKSLPEVAGVLAAARYLPGEGGAAVGGDWYDAVALPGGRIAVAIGDVVGRGIAAASIMGQMRSALRAFLMQPDETGAMADRLNRFALGLGESMMTTVVLAVLEPATGRLRYTNAGHPPPVVVGPDGKAVLLEDTPEVPLGVVQTPRYTERQTTLAPGSSLVLYTDGLVEHPPEPIDEGLARLVAAAGGKREAPEELCDRILDRTLGVGVVSSDDVTLLVVEALPSLGERVSLDVAGDPAALTAARDTVRRWLREAGAQHAEVSDITMACNEACQNAIEHAYDLGADTFSLDLARSGSDVTISVRDGGGWRTSSSTDRGRGLDLMRALMDDVEVDAGSSGSTVRLNRRLRPPPRARSATPKRRSPTTAR